MKIEIHGKGAVATDAEIQQLIDSHEKGWAIFMRADACYLMARELQERRKAAAVNAITTGNQLTITLPAMPILGSTAEWYQGYAAGAGSMRDACQVILESAGIEVV